jgi:hypothetical protein
MLIECKEVEGELYVPIKTVGEMMKTVWPFPPETGAVPWSTKEEREYQQRLKSSWEDAPL